MNGKAPQPRTSAPARVLVVDDHELVRAGLRSMLAGAADLDIIGEAANTADALTLCEQLRPDLVLMDIRIGDQNGLEAIPTIQQLCPETKILMFSIYDDPSYVVRAISAGAVGYVLKDVTKQELIEALHQALRGEVVLDPGLTYQLVEDLIAIRDTPVAPLVEPLTSREFDVLRLLVSGQTNPQIAAMLGIGRGTVKSHVQRIIAKLGVTDRTQAAVRAVQLGLIGLEEPPTEQSNNELT
jgi:DNA-binding NarL/FixJ family response regulator